MNSTSSTSKTLALRLTFIGGGCLAQGFINGLLETRLVDPQNISVTARREEHAQELAATYPEVTVTTNNCDPKIWSAYGSRILHIVVICTKPQDTFTICDEIYPEIAKQSFPGPAVVTVCPGITIPQLEAALPPGLPIVRTMPNTPIFVRQGAMGVFPNGHTTKPMLEGICKVFAAISPGIAVLEKEEHLDVIASVSGSAPAYFYYLMETLIDAAGKHGVSEKLARQLITQSCIGSGVLAKEDGGKHSLGELKADVCVPGGSTAKAMSYLDSKRWSESTVGAIEASLVANRAMGKVSHVKNERS